MAAMLTPLQRKQLLRAYHTPGGIEAQNAGQRVTLASLYDRGYLVRADAEGRSTDCTTLGYKYTLAPRLQAALDAQLRKALVA
jgi:hypothetical protein